MIDPNDDMLPIETSRSGQRIERHEAGSRDFEPAFGDEAKIEALTGHYEQYLGPCGGVFHELVSDLVHVDLHIYPPTDDRPYTVVATTGMSDKPMTVPEGAGLDDLKLAELMVALPSDWPLEDGAFEDERHYWPLRWLKLLARMPHEYETFLGYGHTVPNGDPAQPFAENTKLCCALIHVPIFMDKGFEEYKHGDAVINIYQMVPIYEDEMNLKLDKGTDALNEGFDRIDLAPYIQLDRPSAVPPRGKWFGGP